MPRGADGATVSRLAIQYVEWRWLRGCDDVEHLPSRRKAQLWAREGELPQAFGFSL
jgi:hypothetical protein